MFTTEDLGNTELDKKFKPRIFSDIATLKLYTSIFL